MAGMGATMTETPPRDEGEDDEARRTPPPTPPPPDWLEAQRKAMQTARPTKPKAAYRTRWLNNGRWT